MECWKKWNDSTMRQFDNGKMERWNNGTPIAIGGNVEALAEIPLLREKNERIRQFDNSTIGRMERCRDDKLEDSN
jgi:hypothetical protein